MLEGFGGSAVQVADVGLLTVWSMRPSSPASSTRWWAGVNDMSRAPSALHRRSVLVVDDVAVLRLPPAVVAVPVVDRPLSNIADHIEAVRFGTCFISSGSGEITQVRARCAPPLPIEGTAP